MSRYDYLIVGAGLYGAVCAQQLCEQGKRCLVIDRRGHIAGNAYTQTISGIQVHRYGAHVFHTSNEEVWRYVNRFAAFNHYINSPMAVYRDEVYNLPFNMNTFSRMWGVRLPDEAQRIIAQQIAECRITHPKNLEEQALCMVGTDVYCKLIKEYTEKQWNRPCTELPPELITRLPCRFTYDNNYFSDPHQGIPCEGYTAMAAQLLAGADVRLNTDYFQLIRSQPRIARRTIFTGCIDAFFHYQLGALAYRSLRFETEELPIRNYQGCAVVNHTSHAHPYTRVIEHKHFTFGQQPNTIITREYSQDWRPGLEPYYPINDAQNNALYAAYARLAQQRPDVHFGGRLGLYRYLDMDQVIAQALADCAALEGGCPH